MRIYTYILKPTGHFVNLFAESALGVLCLTLTDDCMPCKQYSVQVTVKRDIQSALLVRTGNVLYEGVKKAKQNPIEVTITMNGMCCYSSLRNSSRFISASCIIFLSRPLPTDSPIVYRHHSSPAIGMLQVNMASFLPEHLKPGFTQSFDNLVAG